MVMTEKLSDLERAISTMENEISAKQSSLASSKEKFTLLKSAAQDAESSPEKRYFFEKVPGAVYHLKLLMTTPTVTVTVDECRSDLYQVQLDWMGKQCRKYNICLNTEIYRELQQYVYQEKFVKAVEGAELPSRKKMIELVSNRNFTPF